MRTATNWELLEVVPKEELADIPELFKADGDDEIAICHSPHFYFFRNKSYCVDPQENFCVCAVPIIQRTGECGVYFRQTGLADRSSPRDLTEQERNDIAGLTWECEQWPAQSVSNYLNAELTRLGINTDADSYQYPLIGFEPVRHELNVYVPKLRNILERGTLHKLILTFGTNINAARSEIIWLPDILITLVELRKLPDSAGYAAAQDCLKITKWEE